MLVHHHMLNCFRAQGLGAVTILRLGICSFCLKPPSTPHPPGLPCTKDDDLLHRQLNTETKNIDAMRAHYPTLYPNNYCLHYEESAAASVTVAQCDQIGRF